METYFFPKFLIWSIVIVVVIKLEINFYSSFQTTYSLDDGSYERIVSPFVPRMYMHMHMYYILDLTEQSEMFGRLSQVNYTEFITTGGF